MWNDIKKDWRVWVTIAAGLSIHGVACILQYDYLAAISLFLTPIIAVWLQWNAEHERQ